MADLGGNSGSGYTQPQIMSMQRDAVRRVHEMQRLAQERLAQTAPLPVGLQRPPPQMLPPVIDVVASPVAAQQPEQAFSQPSILSALTGSFGGVSGSVRDIMKKLELDDEKLILIGMMLLLLSEGADNLLILALGYILL